MNRTLGEPFEYIYDLFEPPDSDRAQRMRQALREQGKKPLTYDCMNAVASDTAEKVWCRKGRCLNWPVPYMELDAVLHGQSSWMCRGCPDRVTEVDCTEV